MGKPKIYLVGDPDELGLHDLEWRNAVDTVSSLIFADGRLGSGLR